MKKNISTVLLFLMVPVMLMGQTKKLTIDECVKIAMDNNPSLKVFEADKKYARSNYRLAISGNNLLLSGAVKTVERVNSDASSSSLFRVPGVDTDIGLFAGLTIQYSLYDGKRKGNERSARLTVDISKISVSDERNKLIYNVKVSYYKYLLARQVYEINQKMKKNSEKKLRKVRELFRIGQRPILEVSKAEVDFSERTMNYQDSLFEMESAHRGLFVSMGIPSRDITLEGVSVEKLPEVKHSLKKLLALAELFNPNLRIYNIKREIKRVQVGIEKASRHPKVDVYFALGFENQKFYGIDEFLENFSSSNWSPVFSWTVTMEFPIYLGGAIGAKIDAAKAQYNKVVYQEQEVRIKVKNSIITSVRNIEILRKRIELAGNMIKNAEKHLILARRSFESGSSSLLDLQEAESKFLQAQINHIKAIYSYYQAAATLAYTVGVDEKRIFK